MVVARFFVAFPGEKHIYTTEHDPFIEDRSKAKRFNGRPEAERWMAYLIETAGFMDRLREFSSWQVMYEETGRPSGINFAINASQHLRLPR